MNFSFKNLDSTFIIAELSANHNGSLKVAKETIKAAKRAGADAIKLQTYTPDTITIKSEKNDFLINSNSIWDGKYLHDLYQEAYTPWEWHQELFKIAREEGLICFSSPFDRTAVDFLENLDNPIYKIASFEITDIPLIEYIAGKGKPIILSTGVADYQDIQLAIETCKKAGNNEIVLLKCTSSYPAPLEDANLKMISKYSKDFNVIPGLSDHTIGDTCPVAAVAIGARVIEKHFILDRKMGGPDASFSMNPKEFSDMVIKIREVEKALGKIDYNLTESQKKGKDFSRSLYITKDIKKGERFDNSNVRSIRPGFGLHPKELKNIIGEYSNQDIEKGERFSLKFIK